MTVEDKRRVLRDYNYPGPLNTDAEVEEAYAEFEKGNNEIARRNREAILEEPPHGEEQPIIDWREEQEIYEPPDYEQFEMRQIEEDDERY